MDGAGGPHSDDRHFSSADTESSYSAIRSAGTSADLTRCRPFAVVVLTA